MEGLFVFVFCQCLLFSSSDGGQWRFLQDNLKVRFFRLVGLGWRGNGRHLAKAQLTMIALSARVSMTTQRGVSEETEVEENLVLF